MTSHKQKGSDVRAPERGPDPTPSAADGATLQRFVDTHAGAGPAITWEEWRETIAAAMHDPTVQIRHWDPTERQFVEPEGTAGSFSGMDRVVGEVRPGTHAVAQISMDRRIDHAPDLMAAVVDATESAVEHGRLDGDWVAVRARVLQAVDEERRRFQRDLHDSAQQRLVALRVHMALARERMRGRPGDEAVMARLEKELEEALDDLRAVARGTYPPVLADAGVAAALREVAVAAALSVTVQESTMRPFPLPLERAVYFSCVEAIQNAAKHAGAGARVVVSLWGTAEGLHFEVADDGIGFDRAAPTRGAGLANMRDRLDILGGTLTVLSAPGAGTRVSGFIPA
ncbi:MAG: sensor histidine kinase [Candidatus Limnocylindrales bacterium]